MNLKRKEFFGKIVLIATLCVSIACTTKKESTPEPVTQPPVVIEKTRVVKETPKPLNVISYGVQIGAYKKYNVSFGSNIQNIKHNGLNNYVFGNFNTKQEANDCLRIMKDLKVKDAFVVTLKDGKIIE